MHILTIPKGPGTFRTIYAPNETEKAACRRHDYYLAGLACAHDPEGVQHGFTEGRSPVTNARVHIGFRHTLSFDLKDFFDTVTPAHVLPMLNDGPTQMGLPGHVLRRDQILAACFYQGAARQGLPSSPALANLAASGMDADLLALRSSMFDVQRSMFRSPARFRPFVYTRYADDLTFSFDHPDVGRVLRERVPEIVQAHGFAINPAKTQGQSAAAGRRHITGVAVDERGLHPPREIKRRLRAARHQLQRGQSSLLTRRSRRKYRQRHRSGDGVSFRQWLHGQVEGLTPWLALRPPKASTRNPKPETQNSNSPTPLSPPQSTHPLPLRRSLGS